MRRVGTLLPTCPITSIAYVRKCRLSAATFGCQSVAVAAIDGSKNTAGAFGGPLAITCVVPSRVGMCSA